jgi:hypothetical protein
MLQRGFQAKPGQQRQRPEAFRDAAVQNGEMRQPVPDELNKILIRA